jgi:hypothetical protein
MTEDDDTRSFEDVRREMEDGGEYIMAPTDNAPNRGKGDSDESLDPVAAVQEQRGKNVVHESELRALIEQWREKYDKDSVLEAWEAGDEHGRESCADELEALLNE